jgi:hypothetical protein
LRDNMRGVDNIPHKYPYSKTDCQRLNPMVGLFGNHTITG